MERESKVSTQSILNNQLQTNVVKVEPEKNASEAENAKTSVKVKKEEPENNVPQTIETDPQKTIKTESEKKKRVLSEGEASSGFETVSSADCNDDMDDLILSSEFESQDYNLIVQIANELAYTQSGGQTGRLYPKKKKRKKKTKSSRKEDYPVDHTNRHKDGFKTFKDGTHWQSNTDNKNTNFDSRYKTSSEDEDIDRSKRSTSHDRNRKRSNQQFERHYSGRRSRRRSRSIERTRSRTSRSQENSMKRIRSRSPSLKDRKTDKSHDTSDRSNTRSDSTSRKRTRSPISNSSHVWKRLDNRTSPVRNFRERYSASRERRKKERTPFLVELERKLKEADQQKSSKKDTKTDSTETQTTEKPSEVPKPPEIPPTVNQPPNPPPPPPPPPPTEIPTTSNFYPVQYPAFPTMSVDNLPLVPGSTGLPVHVTITGEQIPHDMEGRRIPIGPNGYYLPLDPTGRLFPHIVSPGNQAVPIHMTEDGVLRLPNSEPVPVGPGHKFPVNIDGNIIVIGADSKPLHPCTNLPREPPLHLLQMVYTESGASGGTQPQASQMGCQQINPYYSSNGNFLQPVGTPAVENTLNEKNESSNFDKNKFRTRSKEVLKCVEIQKNTTRSNEYAKQNNPVKTSTKQTSKNNGCNSDSDMILDSDSETPSTSKLKKDKPKKVIPEEIILSSSDEEVVLEKIFGKNSETQVNDVSTARKEIITKRVQKTIKSLWDRNYAPPAVGRFIVSQLINPVLKKSPNESPLLKNRAKLSFLTPNSGSSSQNNQPPIKEKNAPKFKFLPKQKSESKENCITIIKEQSDKSTMAKFPVFTFDFAMQCDLTSGVIKALHNQIGKLQKELSQLKRCNANLRSGYDNIEKVNKQQTDELTKAWQEIQSLKGLFEKWE